MGDMQGQSKYSVYRQIRQARTYRTLGKMSWQRVALGLALLASVFFISGAVSGFFAARGHFRTAQRLLLSKRWVETYRPELKAWIDAGVQYEAGDYAGAIETADSAGDFEQARVLRSAAAVKLAGERLEGEAYDASFDAACAAEPERLDEAQRAEFREICTALKAWYGRINSIEANRKVQKLSSLLGEQGS